jgi:hypothetical protein
MIECPCTNNTSTNNNDLSFIFHEYSENITN